MAWVGYALCTEDSAVWLKETLGFMGFIGWWLRQHWSNNHTDQFQTADHHGEKYLILGEKASLRICVARLLFAFPNKMSSCHDGEIGSGNRANVSRPVGKQTVCELHFGESVPTSPELPCSISFLGIWLTRSSLSLVIAGTIRNRRRCTLKLDKLYSWSGGGRSAVGSLRTKLSPDSGIDIRYKRLFPLRGHKSDSNSVTHFR